jgi:hypothetical protein
MNMARLYHLDSSLCVDHWSCPEQEHTSVPPRCGDQAADRSAGCELPKGHPGPHVHGVDRKRRAAPDAGTSAATAASAAATNDTAAGTVGASTTVGANAHAAANTGVTANTGVNANTGAAANTGVNANAGVTANAGAAPNTGAAANTTPAAGADAGGQGQASVPSPGL